MVLMKKMKKIVVLLSILLVSTGALAQRNLLRYADIEFNLKRYEHAGSQYAKAYQTKKTYYAAKRAAQSYDYIQSYEKAYEWWSKVIDFEQTDRSDYISYARATILSGRDLQKSTIVLSEQERALVYGNASIPMNKGIEFRPLERYNQLGSDYGLSTVKDGEYYFVSDRAIQANTQKKSLRLDARKRMSTQERYRLNDRGYHGIFRDSGNGSIAPVSVDLDGVYHLSMPSFFKQQDVQDSKQEVIFTAVLRQKQSRKSTITEAYPGLYRAEVDEDGSFVRVSSLPFNQPKTYGVMHGIVHDNKLYFSSNMPGGSGGFDLYYAELIGDAYGPAVNLGSQINGPANEVFPYIHQNELYFSSDRSESLGGLDIYTTNLNLQSQVRNMGIPYNSKQDDFGYFVDGAGEKYISSDRGKSESRDDIYSLVMLYDRYKMRVMTEGGGILDGSQDLELKILGADGKELSMKMIDGKVSELEPGDYTVSIKKKGYFPAKVPLKVRGGEGKEQEVNYTLIPIPYKQVIAIDTIYYELDKHAIREDAALKLNVVSDVLGLFKDFGMNITSHTDSRASDAYNERLSKKRAQSAAKYLKNKGVDENVMTLEWRGRKELVNPCGVGVDCPELLHEQNRRSILSLQLYPDVNKDYKLPEGLTYITSTEQLIEFLRKKIIAAKDSLRAAQKVEEKVTQKPVQKLEEKPSQKVEEKVTQKQVQKVEDKSAQKAEKSSENKSQVLAPKVEQKTKEGLKPNRVTKYSSDTTNASVVLVNESNRGGYYLVQESWETEQVAVKRADELSKELNTLVYLIAPLKDKSKHYKLAIAKYESYEEVHKIINKMREKYKNKKMWMLDYQ
jgi:outer membrane protein OmpA-like peptidoglycan-associated protein